MENQVRGSRSQDSGSKTRRTGLPLCYQMSMLSEVGRASRPLWRERLAPAWSFYILSCGCGFGEATVAGIDVQLFDQFGMLDYFLPQQGDQIEARRSVGVAPPLR